MRNWQAQLRGGTRIVKWDNCNTLSSQLTIASFSVRLLIAQLDVTPSVFDVNTPIIGTFYIYKKTLFLLSYR